MDRIVITIHPARSDDGLLSVFDAMQQVLDSMRLFQDAQVALSRPEERFVWKLQSASTNTPFTVVAIAEPVNPSVNIDEAVRRVKAGVYEGISNLIHRGDSAPWMTPESVSAARGIFARNQNGIGETAVDFDDGEFLSIKPFEAEAGIEAIAAINVMAMDQELPARQSFGEIEGLMVAAGRYRNKPAIQIRNDLYGFVWATLSPRLIELFGNERSMAEIWEGKTVGITGRLSYAVGAKLTFIEALEIREMPNVHKVHLDSVLDPNFTSGMDPLRYLELLHEGRLA
jgi:hypothetical protein